MPPLQFADTSSFDYSIGQALLLVFVLSTVGTLLPRSRHILGISATLFELTSLLTPVMLAEPHYVFLGITLLVVGPIVYVSGRC